MGKLSNNLNKQLKLPEHKKDAEDCIKIYNWIKSTDPNGSVWESRWNPLVSTNWLGYNKVIYKPTITGYTLLKGMNSNNRD